MTPEDLRLAEVPWMIRKPLPTPLSQAPRLDFAPAARGGGKSTLFGTYGTPNCRATHAVLTLTVCWRRG